MPIIDQFFILYLENNLWSICFTKSKTQVYPAWQRESCQIHVLLFTCYLHDWLIPTVDVCCSSEVRSNKEERRR